MTTAHQIAESFVQAINAHRVDTLAELMTEDHVFVDSDGSEVRGRESMLQGWRDYFTMVPDYEIVVEQALWRDDTVVFIGIARGTFSHEGTLDPEHHWSVPAAWRAVVAGTCVARWQVYVNPEPMQRILDRIGGS